MTLRTITLANRGNASYVVDHRKPLLDSETGKPDSKVSYH